MGLALCNSSVSLAELALVQHDDCSTEITFEKLATPSEKLNSLLARAVDFIPSTEFELPGADATLRLAADPILAAALLTFEKERAKAGSQRYPHAPLKRSDQRHLFRKMNYLKYFFIKERERLAGVRRIRDTHLTPLKQALEQAFQIRNLLVQTNARMVGKVLKGVSDPERTFASDLTERLIKLVERFDYSRGFAFSTLAFGALEKRYWKLKELADKESAQFGAAEALAERTSFAPELSVLSQQIASCLASLDPKEQQVLTLRYGLEGEAPLHLNDVGVRLGITGEWVRQIEGQALAKLRSQITEDHED